MAGMRITHAQFLFLVFFAGGCEPVTVTGEADAAPVSPDAGLDASAAADASAALDAAPLDASPCSDVAFADVLPHGYVGETAVISAGTLQAAACLGDQCQAERLYVGDLGMGVEGTLISGSSVSGYDRITLSLTAPAAVGYYIHQGVNNNSDLRIHHAVEAYNGDELVLAMVIVGREYRMPSMPLADKIVWSAVDDDPEGNGGFADGFTLESVTICASSQPSGAIGASRKRRGSQL